MYVSSCLCIRILFFLHRELVRELTLAIHTDNEKAIKMVSLLGKAAAQIHSFPVFIRNFVKVPTSTRNRSVEERLKAIQEVN